MIRTLTLRGWAAILAAGAAPILPLLVESAPTLALVNETPSLPRGLYLRVDPVVRRGVTAALVPPDVARPYLASLGAPPDLLLLKRVAAVGGDPVCLEGDRLITPSGAVRVLAQDRRGVPLSAWRDCRRLEADEVLLIGDAPESYDGRYFGPVRQDRLRGVYRAAATW